MNSIDVVMFPLTGIPMSWRDASGFESVERLERSVEYGMNSQTGAIFDCCNLMYI